MLFNYHLLYFCTALSLIIMLSSHYHLHKSKTLTQLTQCPFTGTLLLFNSGTSTTGLSSGVTVGGTGSSLGQTTGEAAVMREAVNKSATRPVEGPGTVPQTSPGMNQLIRNCLKSLPTERLSEADVIYGLASDP